MARINLVSLIKARTIKTKTIKAKTIKSEIKN